MNIESIIQNAFEKALHLPDDGKTSGQLNRNRSKGFVEALAEQFRREYSHRDTIAVFSKHFSDNRSRFGLNELLFDVTVCETDEITSAQQNRQLTFVTKCIWAVESEFGRDTRQALYDFNKLVLSNADNKLFVGPQVRDEAAFIEVLGPAAQCCNGNVFVALVPRPGEWAPSLPYVIRTWRRKSGAWFVHT